MSELTRNFKRPSAHLGISALLYQQSRSMTHRVELKGTDPQSLLVPSKPPQTETPLFV